MVSKIANIVNIIKNEDFFRLILKVFSEIYL